MLSSGRDGDAATGTEEGAGDIGVNYLLLHEYPFALLWGRLDLFRVIGGKCSFHT